MVSEAQKRANNKWRESNRDKYFFYNQKNDTKQYAKKLGVSYEEYIETQILRSIRKLYILKEN